MRMAEGPESQVQLFPENLPADLGGHSRAWRVCLCRKPSADEPKDGVIGCTVLTLEKPYVSEEARVELHELPAGVTRVILCVGFAEMLSVPEGVRYAQEHRFRNRLRLSAS
jgi:hypothetical protein